MDPEGDAALVARIVEDRDRAAAEAALCARYRQRIYLYGLRHLREAAAADDLVQDVLATLLERARAGAIENPDKLGSFVLGTCRLMSVDRKRTDARRARILAIYPEPNTVDPAFPITDLARVTDCLARLAERDRTVLLLSFYAELDGEALARELAVEAAHVRVIRHRALGRLQKCVEGPA